VYLAGDYNGHVDKTVIGNFRSSKAILTKYMQSKWRPNHYLVGNRVHEITINTDNTLIDLLIPNIIHPSNSVPIEFSIPL